MSILVCLLFKTRTFFRTRDDFEVWAPVNYHQNKKKYFLFIFSPIFSKSLYAFSKMFLFKKCRITHGITLQIHCISSINAALNFRNCIIKSVQVLTRTESIRKIQRKINNSSTAKALSCVVYC